MRITVDSNILISAVLFKSNVCKRVLNKIDEHYELHMNNFVLSEIEWTTEKKFYSHRWLMRQFLYNLKFKFCAVSTKKVSSLNLCIRDRRDQKILGGAILSKCDVLITGDKDFYEQKYPKIQIITPIEFLKIFE